MSSANPVEYHTATFEWTVRGLKELFESSKGDEKSQAIKSNLFGYGKWQVLFYANRGEPGTHVSIYLAAEPTQMEKDNAVNGEWRREGCYAFSFDLKSDKDAKPIISKKAFKHTFSHRSSSWGWAELTSRDTVYYDLPVVQEQDSFLIICQVTKDIEVADFYSRSN